MTKTEMLNQLEMLNTNRLEVLSRIDIYDNYIKRLVRLKGQVDNLDITSDNAMQELKRLTDEYKTAKLEKDLALMERPDKLN